MTAGQYRAALARLALTQVGAARLLGVNNPLGGLTVDPDRSGVSGPARAERIRGVSG
jgi:hypothetical protein